MAPRFYPTAVENGEIQLPESISLRSRQRVFVTFLDESDDADTEAEKRAAVSETARLSEDALADDWTRKEEDDAWTHLRPDPVPR